MKRKKNRGWGGGRRQQIKKLEYLLLLFCLCVVFFFPEIRTCLFVMCCFPQRVKNSPDHSKSCFMVSDSFQRLLTNNARWNTCIDIKLPSLIQESTIRKVMRNLLLLSETYELQVNLNITHLFPLTLVVCCAAFSHAFCTIALVGSPAGTASYNVFDPSPFQVTINTQFQCYTIVDFFKLDSMN